MGKRSARGGLIRDISPRDTMFDGNEEAYFAIGRSGLEVIELALRAAG